MPGYKRPREIREIENHREYQTHVTGQPMPCQNARFNLATPLRRVTAKLRMKKAKAISQ